MLAIVGPVCCFISLCSLVKLPKCLLTYFVNFMTLLCVFTDCTGFLARPALLGLYTWIKLSTHSVAVVTAVFFPVLIWWFMSGSFPGKHTNLFGRLSGLPLLLSRSLILQTDTGLWTIRRWTNRSELAQALQENQLGSATGRVVANFMILHFLLLHYSSDSV